MNPSVQVVYFMACIFNCLSENVVHEFIPLNYTTLRPSNYSSVELTWFLKPLAVTSVSVQEMEFAVYLTVRTIWVDDQLNIRTKDYYALPKDIASKLWYPWLRFSNCKECNGEILDPRVNPFFLEDKKVWVQYRQTFRFNCIFNLKNYPFDTQTCSMKVVLLIWHGPVTLNRDSETAYYKHMRDNKDFTVPPAYELLHIQQGNLSCNSSDPNVIEVCFTYVYTFRRLYTQHILLIFLPSILIVILSWISFYLDIELAAPRVALGLTTLLTLATQFNAAQRNLPPVATVKALDIWMFVCMFMVFAALLEYAVAYSCNRLGRDDVRLLRRLKNGITCSDMWQEFCIRRLNAKTIDKIARVVFPVVFCGFNIFFWNYFLYSDE